MSACILVRNDNALLAEWIAYHYTVLPLRHLIVGCDENATEDPHDILAPWSQGTELHFDVWYAANFTQDITYRYHHSQYRFVQRQMSFYSKCLQHFYHNNHRRGWVALVDTDEYIKLNPLDDTWNQKIYHHSKRRTFVPNRKMISGTERYMAPNETLWDRIHMRKSLRQRLGLDDGEAVLLQPPDASSSFHNSNNNSEITIKSPAIPTVLEVLEEYTYKHGTLPCHSISRLRYSAVTANHTLLSDTLCRPKLDAAVSDSWNTTKLSTIRFLYHAAPHEYKHNEWTKVLIDLRRISLRSLSSKLANPHRPLKECAGMYAPDLISFIHANHYLSDWSVYDRRKGGDTQHRKVADWDTMAHIRDGVRCDQMHGWLNEFVQTFGVTKAKQLLAHLE
jgi:hypothetical protein